MLLDAGVPDRRARTALACGIAGSPIRTSAAHLFDADRVAELGSRQVIGHAALLARCADGYFVTKRPMPVDVDSDTLRQQVSEIPGQISVWTALGIVGTDLRPGGTALIATVAGFVVLGATVLKRHGRRLVLGDPGVWLDGLERTQLLTGKGRQWQLVEPRRAPSDIRG